MSEFDGRVEFAGLLVPETEIIDIVTQYTVNPITQAISLLETSMTESWP